MTPRVPGFASRLITSPVPQGAHRDKLIHTLIYVTEKAGSELDDIIIPRGFITDYASVPRGLWNIFPPWGLYRKAAVVHDWLYAMAPYSRKVADAVFLEAMEVLEVPRWKRAAMYRALRMFGWIAWNAHRRRQDLGG